MLQRIREGSKGWVTRILFSFLSFAFAAWGINYYFTGSRNIIPAARVNGVNISKGAVTQRYQQIKANFLSRMPAKAQASIPDFIETQLKSSALEQLIQETSLFTDASKRGFSASATQVYAPVYQNPAFQVDGEFSKQLFVDRLRQVGMTPKQFEYEASHQVVVHHLQTSLMASSFTLPSEVERAYNLFNQTRDIRYVTIPIARFMAQAKPTDAQIQKMYDENKSHYMTPEKVKVEYVVLSRQAQQQTIAIKDDEIAQYYQDNIESFTTPGQWRIAHIVLDIEKAGGEDKAKQALEKMAYQLNHGADFKALAKTHSSDAMTAKQGGEIGWVREGELEASYESAFKGLKHAGEISEPFKSRYGMSLVKLIELKPKQVASLDKLKPKIKKTLQMQNADKAFAARSEEFAAMSFENPGSLAALADEFKLTVKTSDWVTRDQSKGFFANPKLIEAAFSAEVLTENNNSEVIAINDDELVVLRMKAHAKPKQKTIAEVKPDLVKALKLKQARELTAEYGKQRYLNVKGNPANFKAALGDETLKIQQSLAVSRESKLEKLPIEVMAKAFDLARPSHINGKLTPSTTHFLMPSGDYVIVQVIKVEGPDMKNLDLQTREVYQKRLEHYYSQMLYRLYVNYVKSKTKTKRFGSA